MKYTELFSCREKVAVVTGGTGLIGKEIVKGFAQAGAIVYVADIEAPDNDTWKDCPAVRNIYFDITSETAVQNGIATILNEQDTIDILVNSAYPRTKDWGLPFEQIPMASWQTNLDTHLGGYFLSCQKVAEQMKRQQSGSIINIASIYGVVAPDFSLYEKTDLTMPAAYSAIKGGIITFTKYLATYYAPYNVRANTISPGGVFDGQAPTFVEKYIQKTPLGRMGQPADIVGAAIYLASEASSYMTGQNLIIDGGWTAW